MPARIFLLCCSVAALRVGLCFAQSPAPAAPARSRLDVIRDEANAQFRARRYRESAATNRQGYELALREGERGRASRFLSNIASCAYAQFNFREALSTYLQARDLAVAAADYDAAAALSLNISSLHLQAGDRDGAFEEAQRAASLSAGSPRSAIRPLLELQLARIRTEMGGIAAGESLFRRAIAAAEGGGDPSVTAQIWNVFGYELLQAGRLEEADNALSNAFRIRKLSVPNELENSYRTLSILKIRQGDFDSAISLADAAVKASLQRPNWPAYYCRARAYAAKGAPIAALADFRKALSLVRRLRLEMAPSDAHRTGSDVRLRELYSAFIDTAASEAIRTGDAALAAESFRVAEEARASSLRALMLGAGRLGRAAPEYAEALAGLRSAETRLLAGADPAAEDAARSLRYRLTQIEVRSGMPGETGTVAAAASVDRDLQKRLSHAQAFIGFHVAEPRSFVWAATDESIEVHALPDRSRLMALSAALVRYARSPAGAARQEPDPARAIFDALFGALSKPVHRRTEWILALEDTLFETPLATARAPGGALLFAQHRVRVVPSAHFLFRPSRRAASRTFVGVADPVYNRADPRFEGGATLRNPVEYPRLAASAAEVRTSASAWGKSNPVLLEGPRATLEGVSRALARRPAVVHFATHMAAPAANGFRGGILLSLRADGSPDFLGTEDIAGSSGAPAVVVLSGCSSAGRELEPGAGVAGLSRAWMAAGARTVVATLWPTADTSGALFATFYRRLSAGDSPAEALRRAQSRCLARGLPCQRDWAAYVVVGD